MLMPQSTEVESLPVKYQKSLQLIDKLMEANRYLKQRKDQSRALYQNLALQCDKIKSINEELHQEVQTLTNALVRLQNEYVCQQSYIRSIESDLQMEKQQHSATQQKFKSSQKQYLAELEQHQIKFQALFSQNQQITYQYEKNLSTYKQSLNQSQDRCEHLRQYIKNQEDSHSKTQEEMKQLLQINEILQSQIEKSNVELMRMAQEDKELRVRIEHFEKMESEIKEKLMHKTDQDAKYTNAVKQLVLQYRKKIKNLQNLKKDAEHKYLSLKKNVKKEHPATATSLDSEDISIYLQKIEGLQKLTEKQQAEIENIILAYDKELERLDQSNARLCEIHQEEVQGLQKKLSELTDGLIKNQQRTSKLRIESKSMEETVLTDSQQKMRFIGGIKYMKNDKSLQDSHKSNSSQACSSKSSNQCYQLPIQSIVNDTL